MRRRSATLAIAALCGSIVLAGAVSHRPFARAQAPPPAPGDVAV